MSIDSDRDQLEILASDFIDRLRRGESPSIDQYAETNPDLADEIFELFPTIAATEQLKVKMRETGGSGRFYNMDKGDKPSELAPFNGHIIGKYKLQKRIGQGSLGTVWLSHHPDFNLPVAVKILQPDIYGKDGKRTRRFLREAQTAAKLSHIHIVRVYDAGIEENHSYLVMEYIDKGSVTDLLQKANGPLPISQACEIATAVADALITIEEAGIVHRDIKPDNILINKKGIPKLVDLGLVSAAPTDDQEKMTTTGVGLGTPLYISPEQAMGDSKVDIRSDIYSLGITLYHMVTGSPPFRGATPYQIIHHHIQDPFKDPRVHNPAVSENLSKIITKMMAKKPSDRYQTASALKADLKRVSAGLTPLSRLPRKTDARNMRIRLVAVALVLCLVTIGIVIGVKNWLQTEKPSKNFISEEHLTGQAKSGAFNIRDWQKVDSPLRKGVIPQPLKDNEYEFKNGLVQIFKNENQQPVELSYGTNTIRGDFTLLIESKNLVECNIINPFRDFDKCQIMLYDPNSPPPKNDSPWQTIAIRRNSGKITCTVNGNNAFKIQGPQDYSGRFSIKFSPDAIGELRKFELLQENNENPPPPEGGGRFPGRGQNPNGPFPPQTPNNSDRPPPRDSEDRGPPGRRP